MRAVLELAENYGKGPLQLKIIAQRQEISVGGYALVKAPEQIKLGDIFHCLEGPVVTVDCVENKSYCTRTNDCVVRQIWVEVQKAIMDVLQSITLQNLVDRAKSNKALDYQI